jgi:hypothetical protein
MQVAIVKDGRAIDDTFGLPSAAPIRVRRSYD